jgi:hypothetical protein
MWVYVSASDVYFPLFISETRLPPRFTLTCENVSFPKKTENLAFEVFPDARRALLAAYACLLDSVKAYLWRYWQTQSACSAFASVVSTSDSDVDVLVEIA